MKYSENNILGAAVVVAGLALLSIYSWPAALAQERMSPLLLEGKASIFQRVLIRPGAELYGEPNGAVVGELVPLKPFYVYAQEGQWIQIGSSSDGEVDGWVRKDRTTRWSHNIVGAFDPPVKRERQLLFESLSDLKKLAGQEDFVSLQKSLLDATDAGRSTDGWSVSAVEPTKHVDIDEEFYIMPILGFDKGRHPANPDVDLVYLQVASLPLPTEPRSSTDIARESNDQVFDIGVMFVIDTTKSMRPYIDITRSAIGNFIDRVEEMKLRHPVHFAAIGFRDNPEAVPGLEYRTRVLAYFDRKRDHRAFVRALEETGTATESSPSFNEDSFAGIALAINGKEPEPDDKLTWEPDGEYINARYIILITDAGPKEIDDPNASIDVSGIQLRERARREKQIILTMHLKTNAGKASHSYAEGEYRQLSAPIGPNKPTYFPIHGGEQSKFDEKIAELLESLIFVMEERHMEYKDGETEIAGSPSDSAFVRHAMASYLRYVGKGGNIPEVVEAWVTDRAIEDPVEFAVEPRLLLSKNELSALTSVLQVLLDSANASIADQKPGDFFKKLRKKLALLARDAKLLYNPEFDTLGDAVELLSGLPYESVLMNYTEQQWLNAGPELRELHIRDLKSAIKEFTNVHDDSKNWRSLHESDDSVPGRHVYAVPFEEIP